MDTGHFRQPVVWKWVVAGRRDIYDMVPDTVCWQRVCIWAARMTVLMNVAGGMVTKGAAVHEN